MKIGIISDIHGNAIALKAVLEELNNQNIDKIICLGDLIGGAPMTNEVIEEIIKIKEEVIVVMGNREKYIIEGLPKIVHDEKVKVTQEQIDRFEWIKNQLTETSKKFIYSLSKEVFYKVDGRTIYIGHYPMNEDKSYRKHIKQANVKENESMFLGINADIYLYGHTHREVFNTNNNKLYINPGALGCPGKTNYATYGILYINKENIKYEQCKIKYDVNKMIDYMKEIKFPGYKGVLEHFYGLNE